MKGKLTVLMVTAFVDMLGLIIIYPLLPFYAESLGATAATVGALIAAFSVAQLLVAPGWGRLSDRYGRRPAIIAGLLISAAAYIIFAVANSLWLLFISRVVQGVGGGTIGVIQAYVTDIAEPRDRTKTLGWLSAVTSLGAVIGPALGSALITVGGRTMPGYASAVLCILISIFAWRFLQESRESPTATTTHGAVIPATGIGAIRHVIARPGEHAPRLIWIYAIAIGAFYGTTPLLPLVLSERLGITEENVGYFVMYLGGMGVVVRTFVLGRVLEWLGEVRLARTGLVLLAIGLASVAAITSYVSLLVPLTLMPLGTAFIFPSITAMLASVVRSSERGLYMGVQHTFGGISRVSFPLGAGLLMDVMGRTIPFVIAGVLTALTLLLTRRLKSTPDPVQTMTQTAEMPAATTRESSHA